MKLFFSLLFIGFLSFLSFGQELSLVTPLHDSIAETSGLIYLDGKLITHTDSGGEPILYEIDTISGNVTRAVVIENATNIDWEDICYDSTYIYIADFGNNNGTRTDLKVYRLLISDYLSTTTDTVSVDTIQFSYLDQTSFSPSTFSTNFDAEAIISYEDSLYIFTKNWGNRWTNVYALPKLPGTYQIEKIDNINVQGLISAGTYDSETNTILLSGYTFTTPFIVEISDFNSTDFANGTIDRYQLNTPTGSSIQIESITSIEANKYYLSAEKNGSDSPALYKLEKSTLSIDQIDQYLARIFPNPTSDFIELRGVDFSIVEIYDALGVLQKTSKNELISISDLSRGTYLLVAKDVNEKDILTKKIIVQ